MRSPVVGHQLSPPQPVAAGHEVRAPSSIRRRSSSGSDASLRPSFSKASSSVMSASENFRLDLRHLKPRGDSGPREQPEDHREEQKLLVELRHLLSVPRPPVLSCSAIPTAPSRSPIVTSMSGRRCLHVRGLVPNRVLAHDEPRPVVDERLVDERRPSSAAPRTCRARAPRACRGTRCPCTARTAGADRAERLLGEELGELGRSEQIT